MKSWLVILTVFLASSCARKAAIAITSPSGEYAARTMVSGEEAGPTLQFCVLLIIEDLSTGKDMRFQTAASDRLKWAIVWSPTNDLVLYSSDDGIHAYFVKDGSIEERHASKAENEIGLRAYEAKYGHKPKS